ncbi:sterol homeostasis protein [Entomortierella chlamydospora]|uniref:Protein ARV n=1 Tax=Entomortierella chlamydospora TaxID=101097 RepID=A0A9P6MTZ4_9FUNG|nr:sterol homeostasis protein [Entomortierella chlamydospora]
MSQGEDGGAGSGAINGGSHGGERRINANGRGSSDLMRLIRERQDAAGSTQALDLSYANLDTLPAEIEFLRDVLEKLTMSHNSIRTLPLQLNMFTSLRYLNIRANSIKVFPAVLCHLASLEILDMSRNKITRFPDVFGNLMNLKVLSISRNRIETIPTYIGEMSQLQFLKLEQNPIVFPPPEIWEFPGQDMESWLNQLKASSDDARAISRQENNNILQQRSNRSASLDSLATPSNRRQSKGEAGLRLSFPNTIERSGQHPSNLSPDPMSHKITRTNSHHGEDQYRFISHSRGVSGDSTSSFTSTISNDCDRYSEIYFQRLAAYPPLQHPLPGERIRLIEAARGILFALSQIYRAVKQVVNCSSDENFSLMFTRLLQSANSTMAQLIQSLDRFDSSAQLQVPEQPICSEIMRCCESNVAAFRKLVHMVQAQIRTISMVADARLVRNLILMLHGALSEIRVAWESLLPLLQGTGEVSIEVGEPGHHPIKEQHLHQQAIMINNVGQSQHHLQNQHHISNNVSGNHQPHPIQLSPAMPSSSWFPAQIPHRSQNMSRTSNHSSQSTSNLHHEEEEDAQLLLTVERAIEAARRLIQCLTETCMTRVESLSSSPQHIPLHRTRSISASPPRSGGSSSGSSSSNANGKGSSQDGHTIPMSPLQLAADTSSSTAPSMANGNANHVNGVISKSDNELIRSPLFSPVSDTVPYSNGQSPTPSSEAATTSATGQGDDATSKHERRPGTHSKGSSKTSFDPALPSIPQDEANEISSQTPPTSTSASVAAASNTTAVTATGTLSAVSTPQYQPIMTARSASISGLPSSSYHTISSSGPPHMAASSLPSQGFMSSGSFHTHLPLGYGQPSTPGLYSSGSTSFPFPSGGVAAMPASQLWREMKDCLLQMTEIVKRLDLDLTMIKTDDQSYHPHFQQHSHQYQYGQFQPHSQILHQGHTLHPHQQHHGSSSYQQHSNDEAAILRRRFGMGVSDFVKSVIVISTLVRHLSTSSTNPASKIAAATTAQAPSSSSPPPSTNAFSTSPSAPRTRSGSAADNPSHSTPPVTNVNPTLTSSASATDISSSSYSTVTAVSAATPPSTYTSASSLSAGATSAVSPEKATQLQSQGHRQNQNQLAKHSQQQQPEVFSRLVTNNVSILTKITKELTVRMPRSSFRDYLLSSSSVPTSSSSAGGGIGMGIMGIGNNNPSAFGVGPAAVSSLYTEYSKGNIRLTYCEHCKKLADKYVEHDFVIIFVDMMLHKKPVYRHLLFNRLPYRDTGIDPNVFKLGVLLILFDVYIKWFRLEQEATVIDVSFSQHALVFQYLYILFLCIIEFLSFHFGVRLIVSLWYGGRYAILKYNYITTTLIISSFAKMLLILMVIWDYTELEHSWHLVNFIVLTSNIEALSVFLDTGYLSTTLVIFFGLACRVLMQIAFAYITGDSVLVTVASM